MARDLLNRNVGAVDVAGAAKAMNAPTKTVVETKSPGTDAAMGRLESAVNNFASKTKDQGHQQQTQKDKGFVHKVAESERSRRGGGKAGGDGGQQQILYLRRIATSTQSLYRASQTQSTLWVGITKLTGRAQKAIADAIRQSGCCGGVAARGKAAKRGGGDADVGEAVRTALGGKGKGGRGGDLGDAMSLVPTGGPRGGGRGPRGGGPRGGGPRGGPPGGGPPGGGGGGMPPLPGGGIGPANVQAAAAVGKALLGGFMLVHSEMVKMMDLNFKDKVFGGLLADSNTFREDLRMILHQTQGFTAENRKAEDAYKDIHREFQASGLTRAKYDEMYLRNLQRGLVMENRLGATRDKALKRMQSVTTSAGQTAKALGMNVETMNDLFMDWHMHLALSANDIADMGRHMQNVARSTGVTGKELDKAMGNVNKITATLQRAGLASAAALRNVTQMMVIAGKHGATEKVTEIMDAMSSSSAFFNADPNMQALLSRAAQRQGLTAQLQAGSISQSPQLTRQMFQGIQDDMRDLITQSAGAGFSSIGIDTRTMDLSNFQEQYQRLAEAANQGNRAAATAMRALDNLARQRGMNIGQLQGVVRTAAENSQTTGQRTQGLVDRMNDMARRGLQNLDEYKQLQRQVMEATTNAQMTGFTEVQRAMTAAGVNSYEELQRRAQAGDARAVNAMRTLTNRMTEEMGTTGAQEFLGNIGRSASQMMASFTQRAQAAGMNMDELIRETGYSSAQALQDALHGGDADERDRAMRSLNQITQRVQQKERTSQDPATAIREDLREINGYLRKIVDSALFKLTNAVAQVIYWAGQIVIVLGSILGFVSMLGSIAPMLGSVGTALGGLGAGGIASTLGAVVAPLMLLVGGVKGFLEADSARRTKGEGILLGALTGGAGTGSMFSGMLGIQKGSTGDKALGVGGAAAWAGVIGAAIGTFVFPGVGTAIGAAIGAVVGAVVEIIKILTEGTNLIQRYVIRPFQAIVTAVGKVLSGIWDIIAGLFTLDFKRFFGGFAKIGKAIWDMIMEILKWAGDVIISFILGIPGLLLNAIKYVFLKLPKWIFDKITEGLSSLAEGIAVVVGWVISAVKAVWNFIKGIPGMIWNFIKGIPKMLWDLGKAILGGIWNFIKGIPGMIWNAIKGIGKFIWDGLTSVFRRLFGWLGDLLGGLIGGIGNIVSGFRETDEQADARIAESGHSVTHGVGRVAGGAWDTLTGGSDGFFSLSGRWKGIKKMFGGAWETIAGIGEGIWNMAKGAWGGISSFFGSCWDGITGFFGGIADTVGGWIGGIGSFLGDCWDGVTGFFGGIGESVGGWIGGFGSFLGDCWDGITGFLGGIGDWFSDAAGSVGGWISDGFDAVTGFIGDVAGGIGSFLGDMASGIGDFFSDPIGSIGSGISSVVSGAGEVLGNIGSGVSDALSSVGNAIAESPLNPFNWFQEGTREITAGGLAMLHPGEMIIPASVWEQIKAVGSGAFGGGGGITDAFGSIFGSLGSMFGGGGGFFDSITSGIGGLFGITPAPAPAPTGGLSGMLSDAWGWLTGAPRQTAEPTNMGAFQKGEAAEATQQGFWSKMFGGGLLGGVADTVASAAGAVAGAVTGTTGQEQRDRGFWGSIMDWFTGTAQEQPVYDELIPDYEDMALDTEDLDQIEVHDPILTDVLKKAFGLKTEDDVQNTSDVTASLEGAFAQGEVKEAQYDSWDGELRRMFGWFDQTREPRTAWDTISDVMSGNFSNLFSDPIGEFTTLGSGISSFFENPWSGAGLSSLFSWGDTFSDMGTQTDTMVAAATDTVTATTDKTVQAMEPLAEAPQGLAVYDKTTAELLKQSMIGPTRQREVTGTMLGAFDSKAGQEAMVSAADTDNRRWETTFSSIGSSLGSWFGPIGESIGGSLGGLSGSIWDSVSNFFSGGRQEEKRQERGGSWWDRAIGSVTNWFGGGRQERQERQEQRQPSWFERITSGISDTFRTVDQSLTGGAVGGFFENVGNMFRWADDVTTGGAVGDMLSSAYQGVTGWLGGITGGLGMGLFAPDQVQDASMMGNAVAEKQMTVAQPEFVVAKLVNPEMLRATPGPMDAGLFAPDQITDATMLGGEQQQRLLEAQYGVSVQELELLRAAFEGEGPEEIELTGLDMGLFAPDQITDATMLLAQQQQQMLTAQQTGNLGETEMLTAALEGGPEMGGVEGGLSMGLFAPDQIQDANILTDNIEQQLLQSNFAIVRLTDLESLGQAGIGGSKAMVSQADTGLFNAEENIGEVMGQSVTDLINNRLNTSNLNNIVSSALDTRRSNDQSQQIFADLTRALDYELSGSEAAETTQATQYTLGADFGSTGTVGPNNLLDYGDELRGQVSTNPIDYADELRGDVSTLGVSRASVEQSLEQQRAGNMTGSTMMLPSMDSIADYLMSEQAQSLDTMIELLTAIKENTDQSGAFLSSSIVGAISGGLPPPQRVGVKNIARDNTRGYWDLQFGDSANGVVTTEGRGGSA